MVGSVRRLALALGSLLIVGAQPARASAPLLRLESVDPSRCADQQRLRLTFTELELEGRWRAFVPTEYRLVVDGIALGSPPIEPRAFADTTEPLSVALVVQVNLAWQRDLPRIIDAVDAFLRRLPPRTLVWLSTYGEQVTTLAAAASPARAAERLRGVRPSDSARAASRAAIRPALDAIAELPGRPVVVVLSDGLDDTPSRDEIRALGNLARARRVPIMPVAYSPTDERGPFLDLSELARRSSGMFRWAETLDDLGPELDDLADALSKAWVADYEIPEPCERAHEIQIIHGNLRSEPVLLRAQQAPSASGDTRAWVAAAGGAAAVLLVAVVLLLIARARRRPR